MHPRTLALLVLPAILLSPACGDGDDDDSPSPSGASPTPTAATPSPTGSPTAAAPFPSTARLAVTSTVSADYTAGTLTRIDPAALTSRPDELSVTSDTAVRAFGDRLFVFARVFGGPDSITVYDAADLAVVGTVAITGGPNPHDLAVIGDKGYISLYNGDGILVFSMTDYSVIRTIDLTEWADPDGIPNVSDLEVHDGLLYAGLQRVDYSGSFEPVAPGYVLEIDPEDDTVLRALTLTGTNASDLHGVGDALVVATGGSYLTTEGGIERVDLTTGASQGYLLTEAEDLTGGYLGGFCVSAGAGYLVDASVVRAFDLATGEAVPVPPSLGGVAASGLWCHGDELWYSDGEALWYVDLTSEDATPHGPIEAGAHAPYDLAFPELTP